MTDLKEAVERARIAARTYAGLEPHLCKVIDDLLTALDGRGGVTRKELVETLTTKGPAGCSQLGNYQASVLADAILALLSAARAEGPTEPNPQALELAERLEAMEREAEAAADADADLYQQGKAEGFRQAASLLRHQPGSPTE